jgi:Mn2+/Fe2+ NRAMP family transporter
MVVRLGIVTGVGHARLIFARFGKFWGAFSVIDLFLLNALTLVTEFIGITIGLDYLGVNKYWGVGIAAFILMLASSTGSLRRFERFAMILVFGSLLLIPVFLMIHPPVTQIAHSFFVPSMPGGKLSDIMLIIIAIVGTTVAPWQLFFQQSYVIDKRITPRFMRYEKFDLMIGIIIVVIGAAAIMGLSAATFAGHPEFSHFTDAGGVARGIEHYVGHLPAVLFAIALIDACIIGAAAVSLSTAYALGDVFAVNHSLHRKPTEAKGFYAVYFGLIAISAGLVLTPGTPLGLLTNLVQTLAGVLLPSATVFLLLLCNDREVLGPWVNGKLTNIITTIVVASLVMLSIILTAAELFPNISDGQILGILLGGTVISVMLSVMVQLYVKFKGLKAPKPVLIHSRERNKQNRIYWRMPPLSELAPFKLGLLNRIWLGVLRLYLVLAGGLLIVKLVQMALHGTH